MEACADLFQRGELADADLVLRAPPDGAASSGRSRKQRRLKAAATELARFPAHRVVLRQSDYFKAQMQRWTNEASGAGSSSSPPQLTLTLERPQQQAAAAAVLAAMYGVRGALAQLEHAQLVDAVLLADMLQVPGVAQQALDGLKAAAGSEAGLSAAAQAVLRSLAAWPSCLRPLLQYLPLPLAMEAWLSLDRPGDGDLAAVLALPSADAMQQRLLAALGDLERVWADEQLADQLLALPLPAMQLLLASDELQVASEDAVLYTAERYVRQQPAGERQAAARERLAVLVRAPQLSGFALAGAALAVDADRRLMQGHLPALRQLHLLMRLHPGPGEVESALLKLGAAPAAWRLGPRSVKPLPDGVQLLWQLPVAELAAACRRCVEQREVVWLDSPVHTPPLGGLAWELKVKCKWQQQEGDDDGGCDVGLYCSAVAAPRGLYHRLDSSISAGAGISRRRASPVMQGNEIWGWPNFFVLGVMRGGWDAAAWAARGLPPEGEHVELRLTVHEVL